jgi:predicted flap endonuclease-1-like 5' DNA nuclease
MDTQNTEAAETSRHKFKVIQHRNTARAATKLQAAGVTKRSEIKARFDDLKGIRGIGPKLAKVVKESLDLLPEEWEALYPGISAD